MTNEILVKRRKRLIVIISIILLIIAVVVIGGILTSNGGQLEKITAEQTANDKLKDTEDTKKQDADGEMKNNSGIADKAKTGTQSNDTSSKKTDDLSAGTSSKPGNAPGSGSGNNGTNGNTIPSEPEHTHAWVAVYGTETVKIPHVSQEEHEICNDCGIDITGHTGEHMDKTDHIGGFHGEYVMVTTYTTEMQKHIESYQCSCGKTKSK